MSSSSQDDQIKNSGNSNHFILDKSLLILLSLSKDGMILNVKKGFLFEDNAEGFDH